ncbi:MAG: hypothetical protein QOF83_720, partial [Solirubrobacteraceae bacterium]|nr:hypothetical protein [Solirubrobacteraceae bacterium]
MTLKWGAWGLAPARRGRVGWLALTTVASVIAVISVWGAMPASAVAANTVVSLTFDDGTASQYWALSQLSSHNMNGTFYVNSSRVGTSGNYYMSWSQIHDLSRAGNEIGG